MFDRCPVCNMFTDLSKHKCAPAWWACGDPEGAEFAAYTIYAYEASAAAELYAERHDRASTHWLDEQEVFVRPLSGGNLQKFNVTMEHTPVYSAKEEPLEEDSLHPALVAED